MKSFRSKQNLLVILSLILVILAIYSSIHTDGLGIAITVVFPFSFLILILLIISLIRGFKNKDKISRWYLHTVVIFFLGLILWTPILKITRTSLDLHLRWDARNEVVRDIKSGILLPSKNFDVVGEDDLRSYYVAVPLEKYGRVSFSDKRGEDNLVEVSKNPITGFTVIFTTNGGFFGAGDKLIYMDRYLFDFPMGDRIDENLYRYNRDFSSRR